MPKQFENLNNPPIIEAVFDIGITEPNDLGVDLFLLNNDDFRKAFPKQQTIQLLQASLDSEKQLFSHVKNEIGCRYLSEDEKNICQFRTNGFSFNKISPYKGWDSFIKESLSAWNIYNKLAQKDIVKLGLRYINIIDIDVNTSISKYFNILLKFPEKGTAKNPKKFQYKYILEFDSLNCIGIVNFTGDSTTDDNRRKIIFDIDIVKQVAPSKLTDGILVENFNEMREAKNTIFFDTLTRRLLREFK